MDKVEALEKRVKELEQAFMNLKNEIRRQMYELDENNFSMEFLKKLNYGENSTE